MCVLQAPFSALLLYCIVLCFFFCLFVYMCGCKHVHTVSINLQLWLCSVSVQSWCKQLCVHVRVPHSISVSLCAYLSCLLYVREKQYSRVHKDSWIENVISYILHQVQGCKLPFSKCSESLWLHWGIGWVSMSRVEKCIRFMCRICRSDAGKWAVYLQPGIPVYVDLCGFFCFCFRFDSFRLTNCKEIQVYK